MHSELPFSCLRRTNILCDYYSLPQYCLTDADVETRNNYNNMQNLGYSVLNTKEYDVLCFISQNTWLKTELWAEMLCYMNKGVSLHFFVFYSPLCHLSFWPPVLYTLPVFRSKVSGEVITSSLAAEDGHNTFKLLV